MIRNIVLVILMMVTYLLWQGIEIVEIEKENLLNKYKTEAGLVEKVEE